MGKRTIKLGKLGVAILEHQVGKIIGEDAINILKDEYKEHHALIQALNNSESRFKDEFDDKELVKAMFDDHSLNNLPSLESAFTSFYSLPTAPEFPLALSELISSDFSTLPEKQISDAIDKYLSIFREELALVDEQFQANSVAIATMRSEKHLETIAEEITSKNEIHEKPSLFLHQIASPPPDFTGRDKLMEIILSDVLANGKDRILIHGMGGIGKTVLVQMLSEKLRENYPDGHIFVDLRGVDDRAPLPPEEVMMHIIRSFIPKIELPKTSEEIPGIYQSVVQNRRFILFLDNVKDEDQVNLLLPSQGCLLFLTSRQVLVFPGLTAIGLKELPANDAILFLKRISPRIKSHDTAIADLCGNHPFALRLAASALEKHRDIRVDEYVKRFAKINTRLDMLPEVEGSLALSYELLSDELKKSLRLLTVFPSVFDRRACASIWEMGVEDTQDALSELLSLSLIEWDEKTARYSIHNLIRLFAVSKKSVTETFQSSIRHAAHFGSLLREVEQSYLQGHDEVVKALNIFDMDWNNIRAGQEWASTHTLTNDNAAYIAARYPFSGAYILQLRLSVETQLEWAWHALRAAQKIRDITILAACLHDVGVAKMMLDDNNGALKYYKRALRLTRMSGDRSNEGKTLDSIGSSFNFLDRPRRALVFHFAALEISQELKEEYHEGRYLNNIGIDYSLLNDQNCAIKYFKKGLALKRKSGDLDGEARTLINLSGEYENMEDLKRAIEYAENSLSIFKIIDIRAAKEVKQALVELSGNV